jgi:adenylate cyclase
MRVGERSARAKPCLPPWAATLTRPTRNDGWSTPKVSACLDWDPAQPTWHDLVVRVHRNFAFVDVSGFTALTEHEGDEHAVDVLTAFRALLRDICARRGVRIAKWLGDGVMLVGVDTQPLLASILELHYVVCEVSSPVQTVSIRSGISSGDVILMEGDDYIGHAVNVAARLCDLAQDGEALATPSVMDELPRWGVVVAQKDVALRGVEKPVPTSSLRMATVGDRRSWDPICGLPLSDTTAEVIAEDDDESSVLFCSSGCLDTWRRRPTHPSSAPGIRGPA